MLGLTSRRVLKKPTVSPKSPTLLPKDRPARQVFLDPEMWDELTDAAEFHSLVFEKMKEDDSKKPAEKVSRNDLIESFLKWALDSYWEDKGGKPTTPVEREGRAAAHAEILKKQVQKLKK